MSTKEDVLKILKKHMDEYYSGQELADKLNVSRTAVWKAINSLRRQGYSIVGSTKRGYAFHNDSDILNPDFISDRLSEEAKEFYNISALRVCDSTNNVIKERARDGYSEGTVIIAEEQTAGKGRRGRSFFSPVASGVYLSVLLKPNMVMEDAVLMTTAAAVAAIRTLNKQLPEEQFSIKWVNDIFKDSKKVAGILTEASLDMESKKINNAVVGIGVNYAEPVDGWGDELKGIAGSLYNGEIPPDARNEGAACFLEEFYDIYKRLPEVTYLDEYRNFSNVIGKNIKIYDAGKVRGRAKAIGIDDHCRLRVEFDDGSRETLDSGEISVRL